MDALSADLLQLQGNGDYEGVRQLVATKGVIGPQLGADLERLQRRDIPVDVAFRQGKKVLGLQ